MNPFLKVILKILGILFGLFALTVIILIARVFDPNYIEFGPWVSFYDSKDCVNYSSTVYGSSDECWRYGGRDSIHKKKTKYLSTVITNIEKWHKKAYPESIINTPFGWECWRIDGKTIPDPSQEIVINSSYKCWPKKN